MRHSKYNNIFTIYNLNGQGVSLVESEVLIVVIAFFVRRLNEIIIVPLYANSFIGLILVDFLQILTVALGKLDFLIHVFNLNK